jgi:hypothetical protein
VLGNGGRQIMRFHFRATYWACAARLPRLPETLTAVTDVILCPFSRERLAADGRASPAGGWSV